MQLQSSLKHYKRFTYVYVLIKPYNNIYFVGVAWKIKGFIVSLLVFNGHMFCMPITIFKHKLFDLQNKTSWVLYNLASFYWRMKGDMNAAIECIRRALHYSPEEKRDVALVNLANILHRYMLIDITCY